MTTLLRTAIILFIVGLLFHPNPAQGESLTLLSDEELATINARGFYFRMDLSLEVFTESSTAPQVVLNTGEPIILPTNTTGSSFQAPASTISLSGNAQSNISSLVNVIGASSVINVGVNIVNIGSSTNDVIYTTNINTGAQGSNFGISLSLTP